jgi:protoporphyrinogen oxidase
MTHPESVAIIGAGPAGLTAAYLLSKEKVPVTILEADPEYVGGIARTAKYKGYHFDIGGHRFFSKAKEVEDLWTELLPDDMLDRPRSSRIFYNNSFFSYPLKATEALFKLGVFESCRCVLSYMKARMFPTKDPKNFEDWVSNQFGKRLFNIFFKTYTEKVWGMSCKEISADWAAQRIKGLSLSSAILNAILPKKKPKDKTQVIKSLIDTFRYPRRGPGMMWEACADKIRAMGGELNMGMKVVGCEYDRPAQLWKVTYEEAARGIAPDGAKQTAVRHTIEAKHVISSAPMRQLVNGLSPRMPEHVIKAGNSLRYRDFLTVVLILKDR